MKTFIEFQVYLKRYNSDLQVQVGAEKKLIPKKYRDNFEFIESFTVDIEYLHLGNGVIETELFQDEVELIEEMAYDVVVGK
jgi:hypothetical protein